MAESARTIVVIHPGGLGDVLLSVQALAALRRHYSQHELVLLAGSDVGQLLVLCGIIDRALPIESGQLGDLFSGREQLSAVNQDIFRRCDLVVGWLNDQTDSLRGTIQGLGVPRIVLQSPILVKGLHQSERFLKTLHEEFRVDRQVPLRLHLPEQSVQAGAGALGVIGVEQSAPLIICHPGSGSLHKCVRADTWSTILRGCLDRQLTPIMVLGPADEQRAVAIHKQDIPNLPVLRPQSVTMLAAILAQAQGYLGHDSGVTHLAALLGVPTVAMFGPTDPQQWAPRGAHVTVVKGEVCSCAGWDAVRACVEKPCLNVAVSDVLQALDSIDFRWHRATNS